jgi:hypothetical protein
MDDIPCDLKVTHYFHTHKVTITEICDGLTRCGLYGHPPHEPKVTREVWCRGICDCSFIKEPHGPGSHK